MHRCQLTLVDRHIEVSKLVEEKGLHDGRDEERGCWFIDDDAVCSPPHPPHPPTLHLSPSHPFHPSIAQQLIPAYSRALAWHELSWVELSWVGLGWDELG